MQVYRIQRPLLGLLCVAMVSSLVVSPTVCEAQQASGSRRSGEATDKAKQESVKIEPYTGAPIYLEEKEQIAKPTVVRHETKPGTYEDGKTLRVERALAVYSDDSFAADGKYLEYYPNTKPFITGQFKAGRQVGEWSYFYDNGQLNRKVTYSDGKLDGSWDILRVDGTLLAKRGFKEGVRDGDWISYDATGKQTLTEEHYTKGEPEGEWKSWYPDGKPKQQVTFKKGKRDGKTAEWDEKGQKLIEAEYKNGQLDGTATRYLPDGKTIVQTYKDGQFVSESNQ